MINFDIAFERAKERFPNIDIKYKDQSLIFKVLGFLFFFNKKFMTSFITTIGNTIYYPSEDFIKNHQEKSTVLLCHELVHVFDSGKNNLLFKLTYLFPQVLVLLSVPIVFFSWKIALLFLMFILPIPAFFRMKIERKAYVYSLYATHRIAANNNLIVDWEHTKQDIISEFKGPSYYFMWPFKSIETYFDNIIDEIKLGKSPPFESDLTNNIDYITEK